MSIYVKLNNNSLNFQNMNVRRIPSIIYNRKSFGINNIIKNNSLNSSRENSINKQKIYPLKNHYQNKNNPQIRMNKLIDKELNSKKKDDNIKLYGIVAVVLIFVIAIISLLWIYSEKQVGSCVEAGNNKEWCIVNG